MHIVHVHMFQSVTISWVKLHTECITLYGLDDRGFESRQKIGLFLFTTATRSALGPIQPPIQWLRGALSLGVKRPGR